jgi:hypothetical protein
VVAFSNLGYTVVAGLPLPATDATVLLDGRLAALDDLYAAKEWKFVKRVKHFRKIRAVAAAGDGSSQESQAGVSGFPVEKGTADEGLGREVVEEEPVNEDVTSGGLE